MQKSPFYEHVIQQGIEQGKAEGIEQGKTEGIATAFRQWQAWNARRMEAELQVSPLTNRPQSCRKVLNGRGDLAPTIYGA